MAGKIWSRIAIVTTVTVFTLLLLLLSATADTSKPASGYIGIQGIRISEYAIQLILAAAIAVVITAMIIYFFSNMSKRPGKKKDFQPSARPPAHPKSSKPVVKSKAPKPSKKSEDISQDYIYGLVMGKTENEAEEPHVPPPNVYKKKR